MLLHVEDNHRGAALFGRTPEELRGVSEASLGVPQEKIERAREEGVSSAVRSSHVAAPRSAHDVDGFDARLRGHRPGRQRRAARRRAERARGGGEPRNAVESLGEERGNVWVYVTQPTMSTVQIDVSDDGPGLDQKLRERIFEPFVTTKSTGTGLGLYVSRMLVTRANGSIVALDREGGGLLMRVTLPTAI